MIIYAFNNAGRYTYHAVAKVNPENLEDFLIPSNCTDLKPPLLSDKEFAVFKTNIEGIGDTRIPGIKCEWLIFDEETSVLDNGTYRKKTTEEMNVDILQEARNKCDSVVSVLESTSTLCHNKTYVSNITKLLYDCVNAGTNENHNISTKHFVYNELNKKKYMVIIKQISNNDIYNVEETYCYDEEDFSSLFGNDPRNVHDEYASGYSYVFTDEVYDSDMLVVFDRANMTLSKPEYSILRKEGIMPPSGENIWKKQDNSWTLDTDKVEIRKQELLRELYDLRKKKQERYEYVIGDRTFMQNWSEYDYGRMLSILNTYDANASIPWRFSGIDLSQTVILSIPDLRALYKAGTIHESKCSLAQYLLYYKILGLNDTTGFNLSEEFEKDLVFVESNYDIAMASVQEEFAKQENNKTTVSESEEVPEENVEETSNEESTLN